MNPVIQQRLRRATPLALCVYVGLPVLFLLAVTGIGAAYALSGPDRPFNWPALLFPVVAIVIGLMAWRGQRTHPASWPEAGQWFGAITAAVSAFYTIVLDAGWLAVLFLPAGLVGWFAGRGLGKLAYDALLRPPVPELAETPYPLSFAIRGRKRMTLAVSQTDAGILEQVSVRTAEGSDWVSRGSTYPLSALADLRPVMLTGTEVLRYPPVIENGPVSSPGPALAFRTPDGVEWVLPLEDDPGVVAQILSRRAAFAATSARS